MSEGHGRTGLPTKEQLEKKCILLLNSMYGNVDAALRWIRLKTIFLTSDKVGMKQSKTDPCVFFEKEDGVQSVGLGRLWKSYWSKRNWNSTSLEEDS